MIKRPMLIILACFIVGECIANNSYIILPIVVACFGIVILFLKRVLKKVWHGYWWIIMPVFFIIGYCTMKNAISLHYVKDYFNGETIVGEATGTVQKILFTQEGYRVELSDVWVRFPKEKKRLKNQIYCKKVLCNLSKESNLKIGNQVFLKGKFSVFSTPSNEGEFNLYQYYLSQSIVASVKVSEIRIYDSKISFISQSMFQIRSCLVKSLYRCIPQKTAGCLAAILFGERSLIEEQMKKSYQMGGIAHILAISGLHISLIGWCCCRWLKRLFGIYPAIVLTILFLLFYGGLTSFGVSTTRAIIMLSMALFAKIIGRTYDSISALSFSAIIILVREPLVLYQASFLLSYGSVLGIIVFYPLFIECFVMNTEKEKSCGPQKSGKIVQWILKAFYTTMSVYIVTLPIIVFIYYEVPIYSIGINILLVPCMCLVVGCGLVGASIGVFSKQCGTFLLATPHYILSFYEAVCNYLEHFPSAYYIVGKPSRKLLMLYFVLLLLAYYQLKKNKKSGGIWLGIALSILLINKYIVREVEGDKLIITMLDVGQGEGIVVMTPNHQVYLIDGGSDNKKGVGTYTILPFLKYHGIATIDFSFISHTDMDHISGVLEILEQGNRSGITIKNIVFSDVVEKDEIYEQIIQLSQKRGVNVLYWKDENGFLEHGVSVKCIDQGRKIQGKSKNEQSMLLQITYKTFGLLLTGDMGEENEKKLVSSGRVPCCNVLKVGHHGSNSSTCEMFLEAVNPQVALISCGKNNLYHHPHPDVLERLRTENVNRYITKEQGQIQLKTDGKELKVIPYLK